MVLVRAWTLVVGYMVVYLTFAETYRNEAHVMKYFPRERVPHLLIGFTLFLIAITEVSTWIIRKGAEVLQVFYAGQGQGQGDIRDHFAWMVFEMLWWYFVGHASILMWAELGAYYQGAHMKMFALGAFFAAVVTYINGHYLPH